MPARLQSLFPRRWFRLLPLLEGDYLYIHTRCDQAKGGRRRGRTDSRMGIAKAVPTNAIADFPGAFPNPGWCSTRNSSIGAGKHFTRHGASPKQDRDLPVSTTQSEMPPDSNYTTLVPGTAEPPREKTPTWTLQLALRLLRGHPQTLPADYLTVICRTFFSRYHQDGCTTKGSVKVCTLQVTSLPCPAMSHCLTLSTMENLMPTAPKQGKPPHATMVETACPISRP